MLQRAIAFRFLGFVIESSMLKNPTSREILLMIDFQVGLTCFVK